MSKLLIKLDESWRTYLDSLGANAGFVEGLIYQYLEDPAQVDERWRRTFDGVASGRKPNGGQPAVASEPVAPPRPRETPLRSVPQPEPPKVLDEAGQVVPLHGAAAKIADNMQASLAVPTATSQRHIPVKVIDENRRLINQYLDLTGGGRISYTHLIGWAIVQALNHLPNLNNAYQEADGRPSRVERRQVCLGVAVDVERKDGSRLLMVPNIKNAAALSFLEFYKGLNDVFTRVRTGKAETSDFLGTTITLTNPGTVGTVASMPRLMPGQGAIIATGAIDYPAEYHGMAAETLTILGISKIMTISCTYDHRIIQGAESGLVSRQDSGTLAG